MLLPFYSGMLQWLASNVFGIVGVNHLIYAMLFGFILLYIFYLTQKICQLTNRAELVIVALACYPGEGVQGRNGTAARDYHHA